VSARTSLAQQLHRVLLGRQVERREAEPVALPGIVAGGEPRGRRGEVVLERRVVQWRPPFSINFRHHGSSYSWLRLDVGVFDSSGVAVLPRGESGRYRCRGATWTTRFTAMDMSL
jgi:hypothetical protein